MHWILFLVGLVWLAAVWGAAVWERRSQQALRRAVWRDLLAGGVLFLLVLAFFWRTLSGDVFQPADGGDLASFLFPAYRFAAGELAGGRLPLWNPTLYGGAPFVGDIQAGFLYPPNLALFLLSPNFAYPSLQWLAVLHLFWAALGMYVLLRTLRWEAGAQISRLGALFGGLAFGLCDPLLIHLGNLNLIAVLSWLPWVLAPYSRALAPAAGFNTWRRDWGWAAVTALLFALSGYAGHAQSSVYIGLALALYTVGRLATDWVAARRWTQVGRTLLLGVGVLGLTLLLLGPILLPALEMAAYTVRAEFTYQDTVVYSLAPVQALVGLLTPGFFGRGPALHWSLWERVELPYLGVATLLLAAAALLLAPALRRRDLWLWLGVALFGLPVSLGVYGIVHGWLTLLLPLFDQFRAPARALMLWALGMCVLAAVGFDLVLGQVRKISALAPEAALPVSSPTEALPAPSEDGAKTGTEAGTEFGWDLLAGILRWGALLLGGVAVPLAYMALLLTQAEDTTFLRTSLAALALTLALGAWLAVWALVGSVRRGVLSAAVGGTLLIAVLFLELAAAGAYTDISPTDPTLGFVHPEIVNFLKADPDLFRIDTDTDIADLWQPDTAALVGLQDVHGVANPLLLRSVRDFQQSTGGRATRRYDQLNVKYVLVRTGTPLPEGKFERVLGPVGELELYRNRDFAPRAWWAPADANLAALELPDQPVAAQVTRYTSTALDIQVDSPATGYLVLSENWYPGWYATVNGESATVEMVNGALRAVRTPAGAAQVALRYRPASWIWGLVLGVAGLLLAVLLLVLALRPRRAPQTAAY